jgi:hypothetical protein
MAYKRKPPWRPLSATGCRICNGPSKYHFSNDDWACEDHRRTVSDDLLERLGGIASESARYSWSYWLRSRLYIMRHPIGRWKATHLTLEES